MSEVHFDINNIDLYNINSIGDALDEFKDKIKYSQESIDNYRKEWNRLYSMDTVNNINELIGYVRGAVACSTLCYVSKLADSRLNDSFTLWVMFALEKIYKLFKTKEEIELN